MTDAEATTAMAAALDSRGIAYAPSESEAQALGRPYIAPAASAPAPAAAPAAPVESHADMVRRLTTPDMGNDAIAAAAMARPADPSGYTLPPLDKGQTLTPEMATAFDGYRAGLHEFGFAPSIGSKIAEIANQTAQRAQASPQTAAQKETARQATHDALSRTWGAEAPAKIAAVQAEVQRVLAKHPHMRDAIELIGNDQYVVMMVSNALSARSAT